MLTSISLVSNTCVVLEFTFLDPHTFLKKLGSGLSTRFIVLCDFEYSKFLNYGVQFETKLNNSILIW